MLPTTMFYVNIGQQLDAKSRWTKTSEAMDQNKASLFEVVPFGCFVISNRELTNERVCPRVLPLVVHMAAGRSFETSIRWNYSRKSLFPHGLKLLPLPDLALPRFFPGPRDTPAFPCVHQACLACLWRNSNKSMSFSVPHCSTQI